MKKPSEKELAAAVVDYFDKFDVYKEEKTIAIFFKPKNNHILQRAKTLGIKTQKELAEYCGISHNLMCGFINLDYSRMKINATKLIAHKLCLEVEQVNPAWSQMFVQQIKTSSLNVDDSYIQKQIEAGNSNLVCSPAYFDQQDLEKEISRIIEILSEQERYIVKSVFGVVGHAQKTFCELSEELCLTQARVREICRKAVKKLSKSKKNVLLREYL